MTRHINPHSSTAEVSQISSSSLSDVGPLMLTMCFKGKTTDRLSLQANGLHQSNSRGLLDIFKLLRIPRESVEGQELEQICFFCSGTSNAPPLQRPVPSSRRCGDSLLFMSEREGHLVRTSPTSTTAEGAHHGRGVFGPHAQCRTATMTCHCARVTLMSSSRP